MNPVICIVDEVKKHPSRSDGLKVDSFTEGLYGLRRKSVANSVYQVARILWAMWGLRPPPEGQSWFVAFTKDYRVAGISVGVRRLTGSWGSYRPVDPSVSFDDTTIFRFSEDLISFGNDPTPCFWGMYRYLRKVRARLLELDADGTAEWTNFPASDHEEPE